MVKIFEGDEGGLGTASSFAPIVTIPRFQDNGGRDLPDDKPNTTSPFFGDDSSSKADKPKIQERVDVQDEIDQNQADQDETIKQRAAWLAEKQRKDRIEEAARLAAKEGSVTGLAATFLSGLSESSPFSGPVGNFDANSDMPTNMAQVIASEAWLLTKESGPRLRDDEIGDRINIETGNLANAEDIRKAEFREALTLQIGDIRSRSLEFEAGVANNAIDSAMAANQALLDESRQLALERERQANAERTAQAVGKENKALAKIDHDNRLAQIEAEHEDRINQLQEEGLEDRFTLELKQRLDVRILERTTELNLQVISTNQEFEGAQKSLDRALQALELEEAQRASQAMEMLKAQEFELQNQQFKLSVFQSIATSPEMLFFLGQAGSLASFGDLLGDGGATIQNMVDRLNERPTANIQEFARLTAGEQGIERFRLSAQTGITDVEGALRGAAPTPVINKTTFSKPIQPGSPGTTDRARLSRT